MASLEQNVRQTNADFQAIKSAIVESGVEVADGTKTAEYGAKVKAVYEAGKQALMSAIQDYGARTDYAYAFRQMNSDAIYPVHDMICTGCGQMFSHIKGEPFDLSARLKECGVKFDTSACTSFAYTFFNCNLTTIPEIDTRGANTLDTVFPTAPTIKTIENIILRDDGSQTFVDLFPWYNSIESIKITGVIGQNGFDIRWHTKLDRASHESIMNALSTTATGKTITFSKTAVNTAFETSAGAADGSTSEEWLALVNAHTNWTVSLV